MTLPVPDGGSAVEMPEFPCPAPDCTRVMADAQRVDLNDAAAIVAEVVDRLRSHYAVFHPARNPMVDLLSSEQFRSMTGGAS